MAKRSLSKLQHRKELKMKASHVLKFLLAVALIASTATVTLAANSPFDIQTQYLNQARKERVLVVITMMSGENLKGHIKSFDDECVLVDSSGDLLLYKHAISSITSADGNFRFQPEQAF
jgi:host factor-I protein